MSACSSGVGTRQHAIANLNPIARQLHLTRPNLRRSADNATSPVDSAGDHCARRPTAPKETHDKGKNDIDDIGNRKIGTTGKSMGDWYSIDTDVKMGKQYAMMVESERPHDPGPGRD